MSVRGKEKIMREKSDGKNAASLFKKTLAEPWIQTPLTGNDFHAVEQADLLAARSS